MKKYLLLITLICGGLFANSQELKNVILYASTNQFDKGKTEVDGYLANQTNAAKPEAWYYKAYIYNGLGRVETKPTAESKALYQSAFDAIKKYASLDAKAPLTVEEKNSTIYNIYYGFNDLGVKTYNAKAYNESYDFFTKMLEVHDYIYDNKLGGPNNLKLPAQDTDIVWTLAVLASELKKKDDANMYYKKIADLDLPDEKYAGAYDELIKKYKLERNDELFAKYLTSAKKHYPIDKEYWETLEVDYAVKGLENEALFAKYDELALRLPDNYMVFYNYAVDIDKFITSPEAKDKDIKAYKTKIEDLFKKSLTIKPTVEANLQLANLYYNSYFEIQDQALRITGTKPVEVAKKKELTASAKETLNKAVPYCEAGIKFLADLKEYKYADKANYKLALDILSTASKVNGDAAKSAEYEKKKADVDKL